MKDFYRANYQQYFDSTVGLNPSSYLEPFLCFLSSRAKIFDTGCGSGRDMKWLQNRGYEVCGIERCKKLASLAQKHSGCPVLAVDFKTYDFSHDSSYDALLLVGALVHYEYEQVEKIISRIPAALKPKGMILISMKEGSGIKVGDDKRTFVLYSRETLEKMFQKNRLTILEFSRSQSVFNKEDVWLSYILQKG